MNVLTVALVILLAQQQRGYQGAEEKLPQTVAPQPIAFSHKQHATAAALACLDCHAGAKLPVTAKCMACHRTIKAESAPIQKLAAHAGGDRKIPWVRVYQIPSYVFFSHKAHLDAGAECRRCHGAVEERDKLWKETDISMGGCMDCHRKEKASLDCNYCHDPR